MYMGEVKRGGKVTLGPNTACHVLEGVFGLAKIRERRMFAQTKLTKLAVGLE